MRIERFDDPALAHVAELVLDRPEALNAVSTAMAEAIRDATQQLARRRHGPVRRADLEPREGVLRRCRPQGAQRPDRRRARAAATARPLGVRRRARPPDAGDRRGGRLRPRRRLRAGPLVRPHRRRRGSARRAARGRRRRHTRRRRHPAARAARRLVPGGQHDLHRREAAGGGGLRAWERSTRSSRRARPATGRSRLARTIAANSPVGLRNAKRAMRLGADVDLASGLEIEDACWRATAFSGDRREGVAAFAEKRTPNWPGR